MVIRFWLQYKTVIISFEWCRFCFAVEIFVVFNVGLHDILLCFVNQEFCSILDFFCNFSCGSDLLVCIVSKLVIQDIVWNSSVERSCWFTTDTCVVTGFVIQGCCWRIFMPLTAIFPTCQL